MEDFIIFALFFAVGLVVGVYIMTQIESKYEKNRLNSLLELEDLLGTTYKINATLKEEIRALKSYITTLEQEIK